MSKKAALIAIFLGVLAVPLARAQDEFDSEDDETQASEESVSEGDDTDAAELRDEAAADESFDEEAPADELTEEGEPAEEEPEGEESTDATAEFDNPGDPAEESGSDADASENDELTAPADSQEAESDLIDDESAVDTAAQADVSNSESDTRPVAAAPSVVATPNPAPVVDSRGTRITLKHAGGYIAKYELSYSEAGAEKKLEAGEKTNGWTHTYVVPAGATNIKLKGWAMTGLVWDPWGEIYNVDLQPGTDYCYENKGTTLGRTFSACGS